VSSELGRDAPDHVAVSVVLPIYNERENLGTLVDEILVAFQGRAYEIVAVDDRSTDGSHGELERLARGRAGVRILRLRRHAGQSAALVAGWDSARGEIVVTLDADGQNDPADAPGLVDALVRDATLAAVAGVRVRRRDAAWKRMQSRIANAVRNGITGDRIRDTGCGLKVFRRAALVDLPRFDGMHRFLPTLIRLRGGRVAEVPVNHRARRFGRSHYGMWNRTFRGLCDAMAVRWMAHRTLRYEVETDPDDA